jgi:hypothetical protein
MTEQQARETAREHRLELLVNGTAKRPYSLRSDDCGYTVAHSLTLAEVEAFLETA